MNALFNPDEPFVTVHIAEAPNGHLSSFDCWCEPAYFAWKRNINGVLLKLVAHEDYTLAHRNDVIILRDRHPDWLTSALSRIGVKGDPDVPHDRFLP